MNSYVVLLKALLLSTSRKNTLKHCDDKKKRSKIILSALGVVILYAFIMLYCIVICVGYGHFGFIGEAPIMCAVIISALSFVLTVFKTNGYLFNFKEYDMLMSLPFKSSTIASCKFLYMYIKSLPWHLSISVAMLAGYAYYAHPSVIVYPVWLVLTFFLPVIPMLIASFIGFLIARISAGFRKTNIVQTVLTLIFVIFCFSLRFIIEGIFRDNKVKQTLDTISTATSGVAKYYLPAKWFAEAVTRLSVFDMLFLIGVCIALFAIVFLIVGKSYRNINSALKSHAAARKFKMSALKTRSTLNAVAFKEYKKLTGSTNYMVNAGLGEILALIFGVLTLILGLDKIISFVTHGAPLTAQMLQPAIPFIIYFFIGMMATTACSPSLEGKNFWIVQSLPMEMKTLYQGKMLFNMYLSVPFMLVAEVCMCISAKTPAIDTVLYLLLGVVLCAFSTARGCVCGIKHLKLDWENEVEVIKQSAAVTIYMLPNMFVTMGVVVLAVFLGTKIDHKLLTAGFILLMSVWAVIDYKRVISLSKAKI